MKYVLLALSLWVSIPSIAQSDSINSTQIEQRVSALEVITDKLSKLKISGYVQGEWIFAQQDAWMHLERTKAENEGSFNRVGIRRGRLKFTYSDLFEGVRTKAVFQIDATEKGIGIKDVYLAVTDPWAKWFTLQAGLFDRPFGYEISYSSSARETPERSTATTILLPGEREVGAMLQVQAPGKSSVLNRFILQAGLFGGNGNAQDVDSRKDLISHLSYRHTMKRSRFGVGASFYYGGVYQGTDEVYEMQGKEFVQKEGTQIGDYSKRIYYGADAQYSVHSFLGTTHLRAEMVTGRQPGSWDNSKSPKGSSLPGYTIYLRNFFGWHIYFIQDILDSRHSLVLRYDSYDPNTKLSGNEIGLGGNDPRTSSSGRGDLARQNFGIGYLCRLTPTVRFMAYYDFVYNEKSTHVSVYGESLKDNVFTMRLQYKF